MKRILLVFLLCLIFPLQSWAVDMYVDTAGSNTSPYETWAKAATDIKTAVDNIGAASTNIYVDGGTHTPTGRLLFDNNDGGSGTEVTLYLNAGAKVDGSAATGGAGQTILDMTNTGGGTSAIYINKNYNQVLSYDVGPPAIKWKLINTQAGDTAFEIETTADSSFIYDGHILNAPSVVDNEGTNTEFKFNHVEGCAGGYGLGYCWEPGANGATIGYNLFTPSSTNPMTGIYVSGGTHDIYNNAFLNTVTTGNAVKNGFFGSTTFYNNVIMGGAGDSIQIQMGGGTFLDDYNFVAYGSGWSPAVNDTFYQYVSGTHNGTASLNPGANNIYVSPEITAYRRFGEIFFANDDSSNFDDAILLAAVVNPNGQYIAAALEGKEVEAGAAPVTSANLTTWINDGNDIAAHTWRHRSLESTQAAANALDITVPVGARLLVTLSGDTGTYYTSGNIYTSWQIDVSLSTGESTSFSGTDETNVVNAWFNGSPGPADNGWASTTTINGLAVSLDAADYTDGGGGSNYDWKFHRQDFSAPGRYSHVELYEPKRVIERQVQLGAVGGSRAATYEVKAFFPAFADITDTDIIDQVGLAGFQLMRRVQTTTDQPNNDTANFSPFQIWNVKQDLVPAAISTENEATALGMATAMFSESTGSIMIIFDHAMDAAERTEYANYFAGVIGSPVANFKTKLNDFIDDLYALAATPNGNSWTEVAGDKDNPNNTLRFGVTDNDSYMDWTGITGGNIVDAAKDNAHSLTRDFLGNPVPATGKDIGPYELQKSGGGANKLFIMR